MEHFQNLPNFRISIYTLSFSLSGNRDVKGGFHKGMGQGLGGGPLGVLFCIFLCTVEMNEKGGVYSQDDTFYLLFFLNLFSRCLFTGSETPRIRSIKYLSFSKAILEGKPLQVPRGPWCNTVALIAHPCAHLSAWLTVWAPYWDLSTTPWGIWANYNFV